MTTELTTKEIMHLGARYAALKGAAYLVADTGEVLSAWEYEREVKTLRDALSAHIADNGSFHMEGIGEFRLQERTSVSYDVPAIREHNPDLFNTLIDLDCLKVDTTKAKAHSERLTGLKNLAITGGTTALVIEKR